jgi:hypothetical protein
MRRAYLTIVFTFTALIAPVTAGAALAQSDSKGSNCRMEQQCHWKDFKKICVWVKVCR